MGNPVRFCLSLVWLLALHAQFAWASTDSVCAEVRIEIAQELTLERQAFEATMRITNSLDSFRLEAIQITLKFLDEEGNPVVASSNPNHTSASFFVRLDGTRGIQSLATGEAGAITDGVIEAAETGELRWLIIPTQGAGGDDDSGRLYFVGATLDVQYGNERETLVASPDSIRVRPQPSLLLDYFLPREVHGDNPMTPEVEPIEPYTLAVRIANTGSGAAHNLKLESAQPEIVENTQGLLVDFNITGSFVDDRQAQRTLLLNFGTLPGRSNRVGRWIMESSLSGEFKEFNARFTHADELGGGLTSLIEAVNAHELVADVLVDLPGRDQVRDILGRVGGQLRVYESEHTGADLADCVSCATVVELMGQVGGGQAVPGGTQHTLSVAEGSGLVYVRAPDPYQGQRRVTRATRPDGSVMHGANLWQSKSLREDKVSYDYYVNLFDVRPAASYRLVFGSESLANRAPEIAFIPDYTTHETGQLGFLVVASDPDGTVPTLTAQGLPSGATFTDRGNGQGIFNWHPEVGQAGQYQVTVTASDGLLSAARSTRITVHPEHDPDGSGGQSPGDGSDGSDGSGGEGGTPGLPPVPQVVVPIYDGMLDPANPAIRLRTSAYDAGHDLRYTLELYLDTAMTQRVSRLEGVLVSGEFTDIVLDAQALAGSDLAEGGLYYWRAQATNAVGNSEWVNSRFRVLGDNRPPKAFSLRSPFLGATVDQRQPWLAVNNAVDPDDDPVTYSFLVYAEAEADFTNPVAQVAGIPAGAEGYTRWQVNAPLSDGEAYLWLAVATDAKGASTVSDAGQFRVILGNQAPSEPQLVSPQPGAVVTSREVEFVVNGAVDPEGYDIRYVFSVKAAGENDVLSAEVQAEQGEGRWQVTLPADNQRYQWWVSASDGSAYSPEVSGYFDVVTGDQPPTAPTPGNPADNAWVAVLSPTLWVHPVDFPAGVSLTYEFELYRVDGDAILLTTHASPETHWPLSFELGNGMAYEWRSRVVAGADIASAWSPLQRFTVSVDPVNVPPELTFVLPDQDLDVYGGDILIQWVDHDPDSNALITLFYNEDQVIVAGIEEDLDGAGDQYLWNIDHLPPGEYRLSALIEDEDSQVWVDNCCVIRKHAATADVLVEQLTPPVTDERGLLVADVGVRLTRPPAVGTSVIIGLSVYPEHVAELVNSTGYLEFTSDNWSVAQQVSLRGLDDCGAAGDRHYFLRFAPAISADLDFHGMLTPSLGLTNRDKAATGDSLFVCQYETLRHTQVEPGTMEVEVRPVLVNRGGGVSSISAAPSVNQPGVVRVGSASPLQFAGAGEGASVAASDTLTLRYPQGSDLLLRAIDWQFVAERPFIDSQPLLAMQAGDEYRYQVSVLGQPGATYSYRLLSAPQGMQVADTGLVSWSPGADQAGFHRVVVEVEDGFGGVTRQTFVVDVAPEGQQAALVRIIDTNPNASAHYRSLAEATVALPFVLEQPVMLVARATSGVPDTQQVLLRGRGTTADTPLLIVLEQGYVLDVTATGDSSRALNLDTDHVRVRGEGGRIIVRNSGFSHVSGVNSQAVSSESVHVYENLRVEGIATGEGAMFVGIRSDQRQGAVVVLRNNLVMGFMNPDAEHNRGAMIRRQAYIYNNTFANNDVGLFLDGNHSHLYNNISVNSRLQDYSLLFAGDLIAARNLSSDHSSPDSGLQMQSLAFLDPEQGDMRLLPWDAAAIGQGLDLSLAAHYPFFEYATGVARTAPWHLGALPVGPVTNRAPVITSTPSVSVMVGDSYTYQATATDPDGDVLQFSLAKAPQGMVIHAESGLIHWVPTDLQLGNHQVHLEVSDARGGLARQHYELFVSDTGFNGRVVVVDTAAPDSGADYVSFADAIRGEQGTLATPLLIRLRASSGVADSEPVLIQNIQTSPETPLRVVFEAGYVLDVSANRRDTRAVDIMANHVELVGAGGVIRVRGNGFNGAAGVNSRALQADQAMHLFDGLRIESVNPGFPFGSTGLNIERNAGRYVIRNNLVQGFSGVSMNFGIFYRGEAYVYNNTLVKNRIGVGHGSSNSQVYNNLSAGNLGSDYMTVNANWPESQGYNLSSDNSSPSLQFRQRGVSFVDWAGGDYRLSSSDTAARHEGVDLSESAYFPFNHDAAGNSRAGSWHLGALPAVE